jgi:hypothetical protein
VEGLVEPTMVGDTLARHLLATTPGRARARRGTVMSSSGAD